VAAYYTRPLGNKRLDRYVSTSVGVSADLTQTAVRLERSCCSTADLSPSTYYINNRALLVATGSAFQHNIAVYCRTKFFVEVRCGRAYLGPPTPSCRQPTVGPIHGHHTAGGFTLCSHQSSGRTFVRLSTIGSRAFPAPLGGDGSDP